MVIKVENHLGQQLELDNINFPVIKAEGLTPASATINTYGMGIADGEFYNSSYVNKRNIVLTIVPEGDVEQGRLKLYQYFKPKHKVRLYFTTTMRDVYIDGYVETFEGSLYEMKQSFQISIICPQPFFNDINPIIIEQLSVVDAFTFPFSTTEEGVILSNIQNNADVDIINVGEETTGVIIEIAALGHIVEPTIFNRTTKQIFTFEQELVKGDVVRIDTRKGHKTIVLNREGTETNIINSIVRSSNWFSLPMGSNIFGFSCIYGVNNMRVTYTLNPLYGGI